MVVIELAMWFKLETKIQTYCTEPVDRSAAKNRIPLGHR